MTPPNVGQDGILRRIANPPRAHTDDSSGADPLVCARPPGRAVEASVTGARSRPGGRLQTRGSAPQKPNHIWLRLRCPVGQVGNLRPIVNRPVGANEKIPRPHVGQIFNLRPICNRPRAANQESPRPPVRQVVNLRRIANPPRAHTPNRPPLQSRPT